MIHVDIRIDGEGCLSYLSSEGHSKKKDSQSSPVCAAVSTIIRTAARCISLNPALTSEGNALEEGVLRLKLNKVRENEHEWLRGLTDFIVLGLTDIEKEFPHDIQVTIMNTGTQKQ